MTKEQEALTLALEALESITWVNSFNEGDYLTCNFKNVESSITALKEALSTKCVAQPDPYKQGYADAMKWKVQNHLEHLPAAQPDNTAKLYEELRSIIDGGSESFTHDDAVQYLKDKLSQLDQRSVSEHLEPVAWWIPKAEQFCLPSSDGTRPFAKAWEPLYTTPPQRKKD